MKFLVINKPNRYKREDDPDPAHLKKAAALVKENLDNGTLEAAYALHAGGHVLVLNADSSEELALKVRYNPLFRYSDTEIMPIEDLVGFLEGMAAHVEQI